MKWILPLLLFVHSWVYAETFCERILTEGSLDGGVIMMAGSLPVFDEIQKQIVEALPKNFAGSRLMAGHNAWIRDWLPLVAQDSQGQYSLIQFKYGQALFGRPTFKLQKRAEKIGIPYHRVDVVLSLGNALVTDRGHIFVAKSAPLFAINPGLESAEIRRRIEEGTGLKLVWLPELPGEKTGHVDIFASYLGQARMVVADSRDPVRKAALDEAANIVERLGYGVHRLLNGGEDLHRDPEVLSYTNSLIVGSRVLLPTYSSYRASHFASAERFYFWLRQSVKHIIQGGSPRDIWRREVQLVEQDDAHARALFASLGYEVAPIRMNEVVALHGMVHCLTSCLPYPLYSKLFPERSLEIDKSPPPD